MNEYEQPSSQQMQQQYAAQQSTMPGASIPLDPTLARWLEDSTDLTTLFYNDLLGRELRTDENGNIQWVSVGMPLCNEEGARFLTGMTKSLMNKNTNMGKITEDEAREILLSNAESVERTLFMKQHIFEIQDAYFDPIVEKFINFAELALSRPVGGLERMFLRDTTGNLYALGNQQHSKGILGSISSFFGRGTVK